jgi:CMP-N,N'-diacetyllegionaminic acid synthase
LNSGLLDRVILTTDDPEIAEFGKEFGIDVPFMRPKQFATDQATTRSVQRHALRWLKDKEGYQPDAVVTLQPTSPFRSADHIDGAIVEFWNRGVDCVIGVALVHEHPYKMVRFEDDQMLWAVERPNKPHRRQQYPPYYYINGAIYVNRADILLGRGSVYGNSVFGYVMDELPSLDIDTPADLSSAESLLNAIAAVK